MKLDGNLTSFMVIGLALLVGSLRLTGPEGWLFRLAGLVIVGYFAVSVATGGRRR